jgi:8-amino-7-oxononanoate synthase
MGTLGKAAGVGGAFVAAHETVIELLIQRARPYIYTTATPPALAHALLTSLDLLEGEEGRNRRAHLQALVAQLDDGLRLKRWQRLPSTPRSSRSSSAQRRKPCAPAPPVRTGPVGAGDPPADGGDRYRAPARDPVGRAHSIEVAHLIVAINALERT